MNRYTALPSEDRISAFRYTQVLFVLYGLVAFIAGMLSLITTTAAGARISDWSKDPLMACLMWSISGGVVVILSVGLMFHYQQRPTATTLAGLVVVAVSGAGFGWMSINMPDRETFSGAFGVLIALTLICSFPSDMDIIRDAAYEVGKQQ